MSCNFDRTLLQDYLDRETGPLENLLMEEHLRTCPECRTEMEQLMVMFRSLETPPEIALPQELSQMRENAINAWLNENFETPDGRDILRGKESGLDLKTAGNNISSVLSTTWQSQTAWVNQAVSFVKYIPGAGAAARGTSRGIKKSGSLAGKALFYTARILAVTATGRA